MNMTRKMVKWVSVVNLLAILLIASDVVGNLFLNFTILHRVKDSLSVRDALSVLQEARQRTK